MKKKVILYISILVFLFSSGHVKAQDDYNSLLWEITGNGLISPSYLFGTMHTLDSSLFESKDLVLDKIVKCDLLAVEDASEDIDLNSLLDEVLMDSLTLSDLLTAGDHKMIIEYYMDSLNMNPFVIEMIKPIVLVFVYQMKDELRGSGGDFITLDVFIRRFAERNGLNVVSLEESEEYVSYLLNYYSLEEQAEILSEVIKNNTRIFAEDDPGQSYLDEDLLAIYAEGENSMPDELFNTLLRTRNELWLMRIPGILEQSTVFIAVGAMHLPGEFGLINGLKNLGYDVTPVKTSSIYYGN